jgi:maleylpyruvate isomerase
LSPVDSRQLDRDVAGAAAAHQGLLAMLDSTAADGVLDGAAPSRLPDWSVGHVLTHIARNADSIVRVLAAAERGETVSRYGPGQRDAEIEAGAARPAGELVADVRATIWSLEQAWSGQTCWDGMSREGPDREMPVSQLVFARWREVEVHRTDLGLGYEPADWPAEYVRRDLRLMEMRWNARRPMGLTGLPPAALAAPPHERLAWLLGRTSIGDLAPDPFF